MMDINKLGNTSKRLIAYISVQDKDLIKSKIDSLDGFNPTGVYPDDFKSAFEQCRNFRLWFWNEYKNFFELLLKGQFRNAAEDNLTDDQKKLLSKSTFGQSLKSAGITFGIGLFTSVNPIVEIVSSVVNFGATIFKAIKGKQSSEISANAIEAEANSSIESMENAYQGQFAIIEGQKELSKAELESSGLETFSEFYQIETNANKKEENNKLLIFAALLIVGLIIVLTVVSKKKKKQSK